MASAYQLAVEKAAPGEAYNVGCGVAHTMQSILDKLLTFTTAKVEIATDPSRMRPADLPRIVSDPSKFRRDTGWGPTRSIETSLKDTLDYWRLKTARS